MNSRPFLQNIALDGDLSRPSETKSIDAMLKPQLAKSQVPTMGQLAILNSPSYAIFCSFPS